ncbi:MAG: hypothetical protein BWK76_01390 [Desulfobulbaceae bacterium A2]|nr:MAG: hypothetical protein BWK76_01390 [Desulfobulbaceae bacterium A2]
MQLVSPEVLLLLIGLALGLAAGVVMHRADYCLAGMFRDFFLFRQHLMLRTLLLAILASMALFELARQGGLLPLYPFPLLGPPALTNILGGLLFGVGMVLAGGCVVGTLYKLGSGSVVSLTAFVGLLVGSALYAEIHPWWAHIARRCILFPNSITLPQALQLSPPLLLWPLVLGGGFCLSRWGRVQGWHRSAAAAAGYLQPWLAGLWLALLGTLSWVLIGIPLGITTSYAKMAAMGESLLLPQHVAGLPYFQATPLTMVNPLTGLTLRGGGGPALDGIALVQFPVIAGIVLGAAFSALSLGEWHLRFRLPPRQYVSAFAGGVLLALASRMTPACNVWHLLGGLPILALQSLLFLLGLLPGAWLGGRLLTAVVLKTR